MPYPTTRANAAMRIAANQFTQAQQNNPNANPSDLIDNLEAVPDVIKDFLKRKVGSARTAPIANLQSGEQNPLMGQQRIYQDLVTRLVRPFAPQMSQGRAVGGVQLPAQKALEYLHSDPDFQSLPSEYQQYAIGVVGGQDALRLHSNVMERMKADRGLTTEANKDALSFSQSPTKMVQKNLEEGKWFVDTDNRLKKKEKNPVSGMEEISPLTPWETLHAVKEGHKTGFGDLAEYINPAQKAGLMALRDNPNASVSDIVKMVSDSKGKPIANLQTSAPVSPERAATMASLDAERNTVSPERLATMKALGYDIPTSLSGTPATGSPIVDPDFPNADRNAAVLSMIGRNQRKRTYDSAPPAAMAAGTAVKNFLTTAPQTSGNFMLDKVLPNVYAGVQNTGALIGHGIQAGGNFLAGLFGQPAQPDPLGIPFTSSAKVAPAVNELYRNQIPAWMLSQPKGEPVELSGP